MSDVEVIELREPKLVIQRTKNDCGVAALACALGIEYDQLTQVIGENRSIGGLTTSGMEKILYELDVSFANIYGDKLSIVGTYIVMVPSLNLRGLMHYCTLHIPEEGNPVIFDPQTDREGRDFYKPNEILGFTNPVFIHPYQDANFYDQFNTNID